VIVVDTSVWIEALRAAGREATHLSELLESDEVVLAIPVRLELLSGASKHDFPRLRRNLSALPLAVPTEETWAVLDGWVERAARAGQRFGIGDLLVGALAHEIGALVWSLDSDFARMQRLKFVELYDP
jgi:predicted nucleic acid-binding protein